MLFLKENKRCLHRKKANHFYYQSHSSINIFVSIFAFAQALTNDHEEKEEPIKPNASDPDEMETVTATAHVKPVRKKDKGNKKTDKANKKADNRGAKTGKDAKVNIKNGGKKSLPYPKKEEYPKPTKKPASPAKGSLPLFLDHFENKRRLLVRERLLMKLLELPPNTRWAWLSQSAFSWALFPSLGVEAGSA